MTSFSADVTVADVIVSINVMTSAPHSHIPYGESGSGHYGDWLATQDADNIAFVKDQIFKAVGKFYCVQTTSQLSQ